MHAKTLSLALLVALGACRAPESYEESRVSIAAAAGHLERGEVDDAIDESDSGLARQDGSSAQGALQRFASAYLAVRAHARQGIELPNLVALTMYADIARGVAGPAREAPRDGALPESLADLDVDRALLYLDLAEIAVHARLGFKTSVARVLERAPKTPTLQAMRIEIDKAELDPDLVPWVHLAVFRYLRGKDEDAAFRFAAYALDSSAARDDVLGERDREEVERWIEGGSELEFHCPKCDLAIVPRLRACPNDQTPNVEFRARRKEVGTR